MKYPLNFNMYILKNAQLKVFIASFLININAVFSAAVAPKVCHKELFAKISRISKEIPEINCRPAISRAFQIALRVRGEIPLPQWGEMRNFGGRFIVVEF